MSDLFRHFRQRPLLWLAVALLALGGPALAGDPHHHPPLVAPEEREASGPVGLDERLGDYLPLDLVFHDEQGEAVTLGELIRVPTLIAPVYYQCPNVCNFLQQGLAASLPQVRLKPGEQFQVLSISFDETETPAWARNARSIHMTAMKNQFPEEAWRFLTGDAENIARFTEAIGYRFQRQGRDFLHPVAVVVVAPDGKIVRYLHGTSFLPMNLTLALLEGAEGRVGVTVKRMLEFCFSYDAHNKTYVFNLLRVSATVVIATALALLAFLLLSGRKKSQS
ncbi:SCO family protein [Geoalkalibacter sp.]|uniref:SCO family protein n=1 Tax=Geoalkalibacter sp. TaxID=3041440 RepID=UPI00272E0C11|nr:SCO family protein [Geoalkalibacter sp.]